MVGLVLKQKIKVISLSLLICTCCVSNVSALTIYDIIERVVNNAPELRIIFERKNQVVSDYKDARAGYLPRIYFIFTQQFKKNDPIISSEVSSWENTNKFQLMLEQKIFDMQQAAKIVKSTQLVQAQEFQNQKLLESIIYTAIIAYYDVIQDEYLVSIQKEYLRQVRSVEALTSNMRQQGNATLGDVNTVQVRLASANSNLLNLQSTLDKAKLRLAYLLNLIDKNNPVISVSDVLPDLDTKDFYDLGDKIIKLIPLSADSLVNAIISNNTDILVSKANVCSAGYDIELQRSKYLPTVNMTAELHSERAGANAKFTRYGQLSVAAEYNIYDGGSRSAQVKKFTSVLKEQQYQYDILVRDKSGEAYTALNQLRSSEQQRISILKEIESSEEIDRIYNLQFQFASRTLTERLDNLDRLSQARIRLVTLDYNILALRMNILVLMGGFVQFFGFQNYLEVNNLKLC